MDKVIVDLMARAFFNAAVLGAITAREKMPKNEIKKGEKDTMNQK